MLHRDRDRAESFGSDAERYDRSRPSYPDEFVQRVVDGSPGPDTVDVGCGTGIAARLFQARGCRVLGVEIDRRMAEAAGRLGLAVEIAPFEEWDPAGRTFDLLISGQAWHWVDPVAGAAKAATLLRPDGRICLFWNVGRPEPGIAERFQEVYHQTAPGLDRYSVLLGQGEMSRFVIGADGIRAAGAFTEPEEWKVSWPLLYTRAEWLDLLPTHSDHGLLPPEVLQPLCDRVGAVIDDNGGSFTMLYETVAATATRLASRPPPPR